MKLVLLIGNAGVGKMTVGQELMKITDLRLFRHAENYMRIDNTDLAPDVVARMIKERFEL